MTSGTSVKIRVRTRTQHLALISVKQAALKGQSRRWDRLMRSCERIGLIATAPIASLVWAIRKSKCRKQQRELLKGNTLTGWRLRRAQRLEAMHYCLMGL